jgi:hypothetical protein
MADTLMYDAKGQRSEHVFAASVRVVNGALARTARLQR